MDGRSGPRGCDRHAFSGSALGRAAFGDAPFGDGGAAVCAGAELQKDGPLDPWFKKLHESFHGPAKPGADRSAVPGRFDHAVIDAPGKEIWDQYYGKLNAANFGISGDKTQHVLWRIDQGELDGISPKVVVLLIGTNNLLSPDNCAGQSPIVPPRIHRRFPERRFW